MTRTIAIVGGVAGGATFAARMRRLDEEARIVMFEKGPYISFANCGMPYHIGGVIEDRDRLLILTPEAFERRYRVAVQVRTEVLAVNPVARTISVQGPAGRREERYDVLLLAPGSIPIRPSIAGMDSPHIHTLRTITDMDRIRSAVDAAPGGRAVVVGAGFIGLEMAENLRRRGLSVTVVEMAAQVFPSLDPEMAAVVRNHLELNGVNVMLNARVLAFEKGTHAPLRVLLENHEPLDAEFAVLAIGVKPDTAFLAGSGIELSDRGAIRVDRRMRTSVADIYAVGDAVEVTDFIAGRPVYVPLAGPTHRQARVAADTVAGLDAEYRDTQGTAVCKVFDLVAATTGLNEKTAVRYALPFGKSYTHSASHATYYPGAYPLSIKLLFDPLTRRLLGAQVVGKDGVDKRIDVFAAALRHRLTVDELGELELAYAPPYGSAKDPVNVAGYVAQNILDGRMPVCYPEDIRAADPARQIVLDVRTAAEYEQGAIPGSLLIPLDELRGRLGELDRSREILVYCQVGLRGYLATRILLHHGFKARNLSGGYRTYSAAVVPTHDPSYVQTISAASCTAPAVNPEAPPRFEISATGLQCPGPIMKLKAAMDTLAPGESLSITASDQGFALDIPAWCVRTGNTLVSLTSAQGLFRAVIRKGRAAEACGPVPGRPARKTMVVFSNDLDRAMAAFIIANGAAAMGSAVTLFFTFWGLNLLRKKNGPRVAKSLVERLFGLMMPAGPSGALLSKMNMGGVGTLMMRWVMKRKKVFSLAELMEKARQSGVRFVACAMSMDIMGIRKEELIDGIEFGGVSYYLNEADNAGYNLFV